MKKPSAALFTLRLFFYLSVAALVLVHPGITVSYDKAGLIQWFLIIPFECVIAFLPSPGGKALNKFLFAFLPLCVLSFWAGGLSAAALPPFLAGAAGFFLTLLLFHYPRWGRLSALEPFFLAWICFKLLVFSRSGEDAAWASSGLTQFILIWTAAVFLFHSAVVYFCLFPNSSPGASGEAAVVILVSGLTLALAVFILPADFIRNAVIANLRPDRADRLTKLSDNDWGIPENGGGRRKGRNTIPGDQSGRKPSLRSLSEHDWPGEGRGGGDGERKQQYAVMVVASKHDPVYMGSSIKGRLDPAEGFLLSPEEPLNRLPSQRLFVTWFDGEPGFDLGRERLSVFSLSTLARKHLPYRPFAIEPTVQSENSGPFRYVHQVVSNIHVDDPLDLITLPVRGLTKQEEAELSPYLEFPLEEADGEVFKARLNRVLESWKERRESVMGEGSNEYMEKIIAILLGFSDFQYDANAGGAGAISDLTYFLLESKEGNCVEFSNTAALLGRLAGIPSRVVTGYLASHGLQTAAHLRGLAALRSGIPLLRDFPFEDLFLVTDAHSHSWAEFYVPDYGWIDFEATQFAIPPLGLGDANMRDVVIPRLDENKVFSSVRAFPWRAVFRVLAFVLVLALVSAYALRYSRELVLYFGARRGGRRGARSLYLLLLSRLAAEGKPIKPASKTASEYSKLFPSDGEGAFASFAALYTELRWRDSEKAREEELFRLLKGEYQKILAVNRRSGAGGFVARIFSLRALAYL
ncbi:MAG: transglutaminase-like domain-containing protein [Treponema sp.]|jgi:hypothetical protein|nr:transglutaminase-like domain-containing protein [Treponema sp.]